MARVLTSPIRPIKLRAVPASAEEMEGRPDIANLIGIYAALSDSSEAEVMKQHGGGQFGPFKAALAEVAVEALRPVTELMNRYLAAPDEIDAILSKAGDAAAAIADPTRARASKFQMPVLIRRFPARQQVWLFCASIITARMTVSSRLARPSADGLSFTPISMTTAS